MTVENVTEGLTEKQEAYLQGLRDVVALLERRSDLIPDSTYGVDVPVWVDDVEGLAERSRLLGGFREKHATNSVYYIVRRFGPHVVRVMAYRGAVCERVVTTRTVTEQVPDPKLLDAVPTVEVTREVEDVSWVCPEVPGIAPDALVDRGAA